MENESWSTTFYEDWINIQTDLNSITPKAPFSSASCPTCEKVFDSIFILGQSVFLKSNAGCKHKLQLPEASRYFATNACLMHEEICLN